MTCANHPTAEVSAYCQQCGKPLCAECVRSIGGMIYCETCVAARMGTPIGGQPQAIFPASSPNPLLAGILGFIPGVGAMYNGQFAKALIHILIFAVFVSLADKSPIFGMLIAGWVFYQVFDAYHTAKARLHGLPLPNPFGLNDLGTRFGIPNIPPASSSHASGFVNEAPPQAGAGTNPQAVPPPPVPPPYVPPAYGAPPPPPPAADKAPVGAIVLIVIGLLLLFQTLGVFGGEWVDRSWPLLIVGLGAWLLYRRTRGTGGYQ